MCVCVQALQLKVGQKRDLLQEFSGEPSSSEVLRQAQMLIQMCEDLSSQVTCSALICRSDLQMLVRAAGACVRGSDAASDWTSVLVQVVALDQDLAEAQQLWEHLEEELSQRRRQTSRTRLGLGLQQPPVCLQAHRDLHQQLQVGPQQVM